MFDLHRLRLLRELADRGTIAATARACALTPSAVSQQLSILQREAGTPLFVRDGRTLVLTEAARVLVGHTERILAELEQARADVARLSADVTGVVRLAAFPTAAGSVVPPAIAACRARYPELRVVLEERETADGLGALRAGHLDLLLVYELNLLPRIEHAGVELTPLLTEDLVAAVPAGMHVPSGPLRLADLGERSWIAPSGDADLRQALDRACGLAGFAPRLDYTSDDYTVILALVRAGLGVSLIPRLAAEGLEPGVRLIPIAEPELTRSVSVAVRSGDAARPAVAVLLEALCEAADRI